MTMKVGLILGPLALAALGAGVAAYSTGSNAVAVRKELEEANDKLYEADNWSEEPPSKEAQRLIDAAKADPTAVGYWTPVTLGVGVAGLVLGGAGLVLKWDDAVWASALAMAGGALAGGGIQGSQVDASHAEAVRAVAEEYEGLGDAVARSASPGSRAWARGRMAL